MAQEIIALPIIVISIMFLFAIIILSTIFWIFMIIDCAKRKFKEENERVAWILVLALTGLIGAIIYYFVIKNK